MICVNNITQEEWLVQKENLTREVQSIQITTDVNPAMAISLLSKIDHLYSNLRLQFSELESTKERIELTVREIEKVGLTGKNEDERRRNAVIAVRQALTEDGITLYDVQRETTERWMYIKGILDVLMSKQNRLITINGLLKLDKDLMISQDSFHSIGRGV